MTIGDRLKRIRVISGLTQQQIADKLGFPRSTYIAYEKNLRKPKFAGLNKIADFFQVSMDYLIMGQEVQMNDQSSELDKPRERLK
jgi:transcriptional regulator with XRE-family HTH domain